MFEIALPFQLVLSNSVADKFYTNESEAF